MFHGYKNKKRGADRHSSFLYASTFSCFPSTFASTTFPFPLSPAPDFLPATASNTANASATADATDAPPLPGKIKVVDSFATAANDSTYLSATERETASLPCGDWEMARETLEMEEAVALARRRMASASPGFRAKRKIQNQL